MLLQRRTNPLCCPYSRNQFSKTWTEGRVSITPQHYGNERANVVRVELIHPCKDADCNSAESPCQYWAENWEFAFVNVIYNHGIELNS